MSEANHMVKFNFHGDELDVVKDGDTLWISVRRVCEALGLAPNSQIEKLKSKTWARDMMIISPDARGHNQTAFAIDLKSLPIFGRIVKGLYVEKYGREPGKCNRFVNGSDRMVNSYTEDGFPIFDEAWDIFLERRPVFADTYAQRMIEG